MLLHRKLNGNAEELGKGDEDHKEKDEVCGGFDADEVGKEDGDDGKDTHNEQNE